jgi:hypothetical protein
MQPFLMFGVYPTEAHTSSSQPGLLSWVTRFVWKEPHMGCATRTTVFTLTLLVLTAQGPAAQDANTNCQDFCTVNILGARVVDPGCLPRCETGKEAARRRIPLSPAYRPPDPRAICGEPFRLAMAGVAASCSNWDGRLEDQELLLSAKAVLIARGFFTQGDFAGIEMRWCPSVNGEGIAPDHGRVYLHTSLKHEQQELPCGTLLTAFVS